MSDNNRRVLSRILLVAGALLFIVALFLPTLRDKEGVGIWFLSLMMFIIPFEKSNISFEMLMWLPIVGIPALLAIVQIFYACMPNRRHPNIAVVWAFIITSIATPIFFCFNHKIDSLQIGYYIWQGGYWLTTVGLLMRRESNR
jgi:hypothetical protein